MEVTKDNFRQQLLPIFKHIADATYITFDLEMSGIATRGRSTGERTGKPSLQQLYEENREAAEAYQVLQVGITCVEEDRDKGTY
jgi:poly(A)-specific ribonuclease